MKFKFTHDAERVMTDDLYYDLTDGGYIDPGLLLNDLEQIIAVNDALETIQAFVDQAINAGLLEVC